MDRNAIDVIERRAISDFRLMALMPDQPNLGRGTTTIITHLQLSEVTPHHVQVHSLPQLLYLSLLQPTKKHNVWSILKAKNIQHQ